MTDSGNAANAELKEDAFFISISVDWHDLCNGKTEARESTTRDLG
jgi:hypothetical protein